MATCGASAASAACAGFGFARNSAATFDVLYWLQVTNYGVLYVLFDSAPSGSNYIHVWDLCLHALKPPPQLFRSNVLARSLGKSKPENCLIASVDVMRSLLSKIASLLVRLNRVARCRFAAGLEAKSVLLQGIERKRQGAARTGVEPVHQP